MIFINLLILVGLPLSAFFILFYIGSLFFARSRMFALRLFIQTLAVALATGAAMWIFLNLFHPVTFWTKPRVDFIFAETGLLFGFGVGGFILFFKLLKATKHVPKEKSV